MDSNAPKIAIALLLLSTFYMCNSGNDRLVATSKISSQDPFKSTIIPSEQIEINTKQDNVVEGKQGTVMVFPKGCFKNAKGEITEEKVKIELSEALSVGDMLLSNLTTTSDGKLLETGGMIYFNATANGEQLSVNKDIPVHIEIPTEKKKAGMKAYKGIRDENGNMNWVEPKELDNFLVPVDLRELDFLPNGFRAGVDQGMPFRNHKEATNDLTDSLYYSLSVSNGSELTEEFVGTHYNEPFYNKNKKVVKGKYTSNSYSTDEIIDPVNWTYSTEKINEKEYYVLIKANIQEGWHIASKTHNSNAGPVPTSLVFNNNAECEIVGDMMEINKVNYFEKVWGMNIGAFEGQAIFKQKIRLINTDQASLGVSIESMAWSNTVAIPPKQVYLQVNINKTCGIDPAGIKVIRSDKYQNTLIATREFETRLKLIFKTCKNNVLDVYVNNIGKKLCELDSMAALAVGEATYAEEFRSFAKQGLTNVKESDKYSNLLKGYYEKQLAKVKSELEASKQRTIKVMKQKNADAQSVADEYKGLLWKREKYRMETYGFEWTDTGWINVDNGVLPKDWSAQPLEILVENGKQFDRVYTYVVYTSIKSLYRLNSSNNVDFYVGNDEQKKMFMPKKKLGVAIAIAYKGEEPSMAIKEFETGSEPQFSLSLTASTLSKVKAAIRPYEGYKQENKIDEDLKYMALFYREEQRQKELRKEGDFILGLWYIAHPCCALVADSIQSYK